MIGSARIAAGAALCACALAAALIATLLAPVPDILETPLVAAAPDWIVRAVRLAETAGPPPPVYVLDARIDDPATLLRSAALTVRFATSASEPVAANATLDVLGTSCVFATAPATELHPNGRLVFNPGDGCRSVQGLPTGELKLTVRLERRAELIVFALQPPEATRTPGAMTVSGSPGWAYQGPPLALDAKFVTPLQSTRTRRIDLLAYMWQVSDGVRWIWWAIACAMGLLTIGAVLLLADTATPGTGTRLPLRAALGTGSIAVALGLLYGVLAPPLHAPDEIDHLLEFASLTGRQPLAEDAASWARRTHFERIKFRPDEHFRPVDRDAPFPHAWADHVVAENVAARSPTATAWWKWLGRWMPGRSVAATLLSIRIANVLLFGLAVGLGAALLSWSADGRLRPALLGTFPLFVPALPFFAMHASETSVVSSTYVVFAYCALALFLDGRRTATVGLPLGLASGLIVSSTRSALPMVPLLAAVLGARAVLGSREASEPRTQRRSALQFWLAFSIGAFVAVATMEPHFVAEIQANLRGIGTFPGWFQVPLNHLWLLFFASVAIGFALELAFGRVRVAADPLATRFRGRLRGMARSISWTTAGLIALSLVLSLFVAYPHLLVNGLTPPSVRAYAVKVVLTQATSFRLRDPDFLLSSSFWIGFGWLETVPSLLLVNALVATTAVALIALLFRIGRDRDLRRFVWLSIVGAGGCATVATYAVTAFPMRASLHGRYLIGLYLVALAIGFSVFSTRSIEESKTRVWSSAAALLIVGSVHVYCLRFILARYF